jgi:3,4-dihydroxy-2-butanone 4-phosphate synthase/GTP cyclohydrolase II
MNRWKIQAIFTFFALWKLHSICGSSASMSTKGIGFESPIDDQDSLIGKSKQNIEKKSGLFHIPTVPSHEITSHSTESNVLEEDTADSHTTSYVAECAMPTSNGFFRMRSYTYTSPRVYLEPIVIVSGDVRGKENVVVRVHDQCFTSEVFGSMRCDCKDQLKESLNLIRREGGVVIYLQQEGRGIGIANKVAAYKLQDEGYDTVDANLHLGFKDEMREYLCVPDILADMDIRSVRLVTNNPYKIDQLQSLGVKITDRIGIVIPPTKFNQRYLKSKRERMNHFMPVESETIEPRENIVYSAAAMATTIPESEDKTQPETTGYQLDKQVNQAMNIIPREDLKNTYALGRQTVLDAIDAVAKGQIVIVVDDENRENEGDLIMAAEHATPDAIGFMVRHTSGVICVSLESDRLDELKLPPMVINNQDPKQTAYSVSVDFKHNTSTGISSADRAACFRALVDPSKTAEDFQRPGHVFPLRYKNGGVIARGGHTEASLDLCRLAGLRPGGVLAEVVNDDGSLKRLPDLMTMAKEYNLVITSVQDITAYRIEQLEKGL